MDFKEFVNQIPFKINSINFVKRDNLNFLDIELPDTDLKSINEKSKIISQLLDDVDLIKENYYLNVFSSGTEHKIDMNNISLYIDKYVLVKLSKHILDKTIWEGNLINSNPNNITIKINNKGKFQKLNINRSDIVEIKTTAKIRKAKSKYETTS